MTLTAVDELQALAKSRGPDHEWGDTRIAPLPAVGGEVLYADSFADLGN